MLKIAFVATLAAFVTAWMSPPDLTIYEKASLTTVKIDEYCSGTVIDKDEGLIVTANHCIRDLMKYTTVVKEYPDGHQTSTRVLVFTPVSVRQNRLDIEGNIYLRLDVKATVVGYNEKYDVAILKVLTADKVFPIAAKLSTHPVYYGQIVYHSGQPLSVDNIVSQGRVMLPRLNFAPVPMIPEDAIVHDAFMAPGSSGGSLYNEEGDLIGVTNWGVAGGPYLASRVTHVIELLKERHLGAYKDQS